MYCIGESVFFFKERNDSTGQSLATENVLRLFKDSDEPSSLYKIS